MKDPQFCEVTWIDAWADGVDDTTSEDVHLKHTPLTMVTRGWVLKNDEVGVSMFHERCVDPASYRGRTFIPAGMIKSVEPYPKIKTRKPRVKKIAPLDI